MDNELAGMGLASGLFSSVIQVPFHHQAFQ